MSDVVQEFFLIHGVSEPPTNMEELIPYLMSVVVAVCMVSGVFSIIGKVLDVFFNTIRFR